MSERKAFGDIWPRLIPITTKEQFETVVKEAEADGHPGLSPTHAILKGNHVAGAVTLRTVPWIGQWYHTQRMGARDSLGMVNVLDNLMAQAGHRMVVFTLDDTSPFLAIAERAGLKPLDPKAKVFYRFI